MAHQLLRFYLAKVRSSAVEEVFESHEGLRALFDSLALTTTDAPGEPPIVAELQGLATDIIWDSEGDDDRSLCVQALAESLKQACELLKVTTDHTAAFSDAMLTLGNAEVYWNKEQRYV
jgi:hypothetical protein